MMKYYDKFGLMNINDYLNREIKKLITGSNRDDNDIL